MEGTGGLRFDASLVHSDVPALLDVPQLYTRLNKCLLERERAAEYERDQIRTPKVADIGGLGVELPIPPQAVARDIRANVNRFAKLGQHRLAGLGHCKQRTGLRV